VDYCKGTTPKHRNNTMKKIIQKLQKRYALKEAHQNRIAANATCNYSNNYYGDRACKK
jgi:hypothetical protein